MLGAGPVELRRLASLNLNEMRSSLRIPKVRRSFCSAASAAMLSVLSLLTACGSDGATGAAVAARGGASGSATAEMSGAANSGQSGAGAIGMAGAAGKRAAGKSGRFVQRRYSRVGATRGYFEPGHGRGQRQRDAPVRCVSASTRSSKASCSFAALKAAVALAGSLGRCLENRFRPAEPLIHGSGRATGPQHDRTYMAQLSPEPKSWLRDRPSRSDSS
jgi:hypothetical protein